MSSEDKTLAALEAALSRPEDTAAKEAVFKPLGWKGAALCYLGFLISGAVSAWIFLWTEARMEMLSEDQNVMLPTAAGMGAIMAAVPIVIAIIWRTVQGRVGRRQKTGQPIFLLACVFLGWCYLFASGPSGGARYDAEAYAFQNSLCSHPVYFPKKPTVERRSQPVVAARVFGDEIMVGAICIRQARMAPDEATADRLTAETATMLEATAHTATRRIRGDELLVEFQATKNGQVSDA